MDSNIIAFPKFHAPNHGGRVFKEITAAPLRAPRFRKGDRVMIIYGHRAGSTGVTVKHAIDRAGHEIHSILIDGLGLMAIERADYLQPVKKEPSCPKSE